MSFLKTEHDGIRIYMYSTTNRVTWLDWHYFCYGIQCAIRSNASVALCNGDGGCLSKPRRQKIRRLLQEKCCDARSPRCQVNWANDMLVVLNHIESLVDPAESSDLADGFVHVSSKHSDLSFACKLWFPRMLKALSIRLVFQMMNWYPHCFSKKEPEPGHS